MYAIGDVLCTSIGRRTKGLSEHMHRSPNLTDQCKGIFDLSGFIRFLLPGSIYHLLYQLSVYWVRCAMRTGMGASDVSHPLGPHTSLSTVICTALHTISSVLLCANEKEFMRGMSSLRQTVVQIRSPWNPPSMPASCRLKMMPHPLVVRFFARYCFFLFSFSLLIFLFFASFFRHCFCFIIYSSCLNNWLIDAVWLTVVVIHPLIHPFGWRTGGRTDKCQDGLFRYGSEL